MAIYAGCQNKFIVQHPAHFLLFLKAPPVKPRPHSQISFKSWLYNVGLELRFLPWPLPERQAMVTQTF